MVKATVPPQAPAGSDPDSRSTPQTFDTREFAAPAQLSRLTAEAALAECLGAIAGEHGVPITTTSAVDYARFSGKPALVVFFVDADNARWAWVAGPDCGPGGADTQYSTRVA
jgi:hypothetical protein